MQASALDSEYLKTTAKASYFHMLSESADMIGQVSVGAGTSRPVGGGNLSVFDHLFVGQETIRGLTHGASVRAFSMARPMSVQPAVPPTSTARSRFPLRCRLFRVKWVFASTSLPMRQRFTATTSAR
jgi:hypothetical protein